MIGEKYGLVTVVEIIYGGVSKCIVKCDCGKTREVGYNKVAEQQVNSCGDIDCKRKLRDMRKIYRTGFGCRK